MKTKYYLFGIVLIFLSGNIALSQDFIQSVCCDNTITDYSDIEKFSLEIAIAEMNNENHKYHDSLLVPGIYLDSIMRLMSAYHYVMGLSDSIIDYREFLPYDLNNSNSFVILEFNNPSNIFTNDDAFKIINDTLKRYVDSLGLVAQSNNLNELVLRDTRFHVNLKGSFDFFFNISSLKMITPIFIEVDYDKFKSRYGYFKNDQLEIWFTDFDNSNPNKPYQYNWNYNITNNCEVVLKKIPTAIDQKKISNLKVFPNPFSDFLYFNSYDTIERIDFYSLNGELIVTKEYVDNRLITDNLKDGVYQVIIYYKNGVLESKQLIRLAKH
ncbi:MAG: T9SS type A sorting domain-containing protein [Prolixibacteraceae bacterium]|jgi:hypothetical protein|nr:T9SS type A sorting domain-containing protein [Prolixibacteraceae bacterium]